MGLIRGTTHSRHRFRFGRTAEIRPCMHKKPRQTVSGTAGVDFGDFLLLDVLGDEFGHLKHADLLLATEDRFEGGVGVDQGPLLGILEFVLLDVVPELLGHLATGQRFCAAKTHRRRFALVSAPVSTGRVKNYGEMCKEISYCEQLRPWWERPPP